MDTLKNVQKGRFPTDLGDFGLSAQIGAKPVFSGRRRWSALYCRIQIATPQR